MDVSLTNTPPPTALQTICHVKLLRCAVVAFTRTRGRPNPPFRGRRTILAIWRDVRVLRNTMSRGRGIGTKVDWTPRPNCALMLHRRQSPFGRWRLRDTTALPLVQQKGVCFQCLTLPMSPCLATDVCSAAILGMSRVAIQCVATVAPYRIPTPRSGPKTHTSPQTRSGL